MKEGPDISIVAALIGNPASANMLMALMAGPALTATELAQEAGLMLSTVSGHLAKLENARLVAVERQGRHRYFRLADASVASALEGLIPLAARAGHTRIRTGPRDPELRRAPGAASLFPPCGCKRRERTRGAHSARGPRRTHAHPHRAARPRIASRAVLLRSSCRRLGG